MDRVQILIMDRVQILIIDRTASSERPVHYSQHIQNGLDVEKERIPGPIPIDTRSRRHPGERAGIPSSVGSDGRR